MDLLGLLRSRLLPAVITALGAALVVAGLLSYGDPVTAGTVAMSSPTPAATATPAPSVRPSASAVPGSAGPTGEPERAVASRVVVPALEIDLAVMAGTKDYPPCDVAMYLDAMGQPGEGRATYLYAHARDGMFGPIYELAILRSAPERLLGMIVQVYTTDHRMFLYEVKEVRIHQTSLQAAFDVRGEELWLQTSEGPRGTVGKTQVRAVPIGLPSAADPAVTTPVARPVACG